MAEDEYFPIFDLFTFHNDVRLNPDIIGTAPLAFIIDYMNWCIETRPDVASSNIRFVLSYTAYTIPDTLVTIVKQRTLSLAVHACIFSWFEDIFLNKNHVDEFDEVVQHSRFTPELFVEFLSSIRLTTPSHHRYKSFYSIQAWLYQWIRHPIVDVSSVLRLLDTVPWMQEFKSNMYRLDFYLEDDNLEAVTEWCLPIWQTKSDYVDRILSSRLILYSMAPCWPVLSRDTALYTVIEQRRNEDHHGWRSDRHHSLWRTLHEIRYRRHRITFRAVLYGQRMWSLYLHWSLHPDRLLVASSALATATAVTRTAIDSRIAAATRPNTGETTTLPSEFRIRTVADYFYHE